MSQTACFSWLPSPVLRLENIGWQVQVKLGSECIRRRKLYKAVQCNNLEQAREILNQGLDLEKHTILLDVASVRGYRELFRLLMQYYDVHHPLIRTRALDIAVWQGDLEITKMLLEAGIDFKSRNCYGETILYVAARGNSAALVELFMDLGCDVNAKTRGVAPIHVAVQKGHVETQRALIQNGCDVNLLEDRNGQSPLSLAISSGRYDCLYNLIQAGCSINMDELCSNTAVQQQFRKHPRWFSLLKKECRGVKSLSELCRRNIRKSIGAGLSRKVKCLGLPVILQDYISLVKDLDNTKILEQRQRRQVKRKRPISASR